MPFLKLCGQFVLAVLLATVLGTLAQTQFNLAQISALGVPVPLELRLQVTGRDLLGFSPSFGPIVAIGFLLAFGFTAWLRRRWALSATAIYALAGASAILTALLTMNAVFDLTAVAAARSPAGLLCLVLAGAAGGGLFGHLRAAS